MSEPISLATAREARQRPNANCIKRNDDGREMQLYALAYEFDGGHWSAELWAYSEADAEARVAAMRETLAVGGPVYAVIPR